MAQRELFMKYKDAMYTTLIRMLNEEDEATDALQETFVSVFKGLESFKHQSTLGAWIKTIAVRTGLAHQRKQRYLHEENLDSLGQNEPIVWPENLTSEVLSRAIAELPPGYRTIFLLTEVEGYTHREVAEMTGVNEGTSKSQLYHAKRTLQKSLQDYRYGHGEG